MSVYVVDASVAAQWFLEEASSNAAVRLLKDGHWLHAPDFLLIEIDSVISKRIRRKEISEKEGRRVRTAFRQFPIQCHNFLSLLDPAYEIAISTSQAIYDCLYVALAARLDAPMVTADRRLYAGLANGPFARYLLWVQDIT